MRAILIRAAMLAATLVAVPAAFAAQPAVSFRTIEFNAGDRVAEAHNALGSAIPAGTSLATAEAVLSDAGAKCRPSRHETDTIRCLYREMSAADESFDDIRWTTHLRTAGGLVTNLTVDRTVDRHGN